MPSLRDGWPGGRHASGTPIREARVARAAQHWPEVTLTMPAWKWKHATDRLGGIQEGTQTHKRTHQPHTRTGARTGTRTCINALLLPRLALLLGKLLALLRDQLDHPLHVETGHRTAGDNAVPHVATQHDPSRSSTPARVATQHSAWSTLLRAWCFRFLYSTNTAATTAAMQTSDTTTPMITAEFPAPSSAAGAAVLGVAGFSRALACEKRGCGLPPLTTARGDRGPQSCEQRSSVLPADGALLLLLLLLRRLEPSCRCPHRSTSPLAWP